jgi:hypothetical protein
LLIKTKLIPFIYRNKCIRYIVFKYSASASTETGHLNIEQQWPFKRAPTGKLFEKVILKILQKHIEERGLLNASQFGFRARHSMRVQCMRLADHVTLNFNNEMSMAAVFLDTEKAFDTT